MTAFHPDCLLVQKRAGIVELEFYGFILYLNRSGVKKRVGLDNNYPFFHRSCAKPLQASLIKDFKTDKFYDLTEKEIAVCCGSHTGESCHIEILKNLLAKADLREENLKCPVIPPLNNFDSLKKFSPLHNNCSGKHTLMLMICRQNGWDIEHYLSFEHPLQKNILLKLEALCFERNLKATLDGCTAPNWATSLEGLGKGFLELAAGHKFIVDAMRNNPYYVGGLNRLDTHIMQISDYITAKVGAGGLCVIVNTLTNEALVVKVMDADMKARTIIALEAVKQLNWINNDSIDSNLLKYFDSCIYTENGIKVGEYTPCFSL